MEKSSYNINTSANGLSEEKIIRKEMSKKYKLPVFDRSIFTVDISLNDKIKNLSANADFQENHKKLRSLIHLSDQKQEQFQ